VSSEESRLAAEALVRWVALDAPLDTLVSLQVRLDWQAARAVDSSAPDQQLTELMRTVRTVLACVEARRDWDGRPELETWRRLVRDGMSPQEAGAAAAAIHFPWP
jgi:hypothetical protein